MLVPRSWDYKSPPSGKTRLNRDHELAKGLKFAYSPVNGDMVALDRVTGKLGTFGTIEAQIKERGWCWYLGGQNDAGFELSGLSIINDLFYDDFSMCMWIAINRNASDTYFYVGNGTDSARIRYNSSVLSFEYQLYSSGWTKLLQHDLDVSVDIGIWHCVVASNWGGQAGQIQIWIDGIPSGSTPSGLLQAGGSPFTIVNYGNYHGMDGGYGWVGDAYIWNRQLTDADALQLYREPWVLHEPVTPLYWQIPFEAPVQQSLAIPNVLLNRGGWVGDKPPTVDFRINKRSPQYKGLKHWLPLVKDEGARARDFTDRLGLTSYVSPLWTPTEKGIAAGFDGNGTTSTSYIRLNESSGDTLLPGTSFPSMVSVWFYANTISDEGSADHAFIWALAVSGGLSGYPLSLFVSNASGWYPLTVTTRANDTYYSIRPTTGVAWDGNFDDQWHHITWMYNGRGASTLSNYKIIWNGVEQTIEASGTLPLGDSNSYLGLYEQPSDQYLVGQIQDFRVYDNFDTVLAQEIYRNRFELFEPIQPQFYWEIPAEAGTVFPFSDDFTGNTGDPWDITKWTTSVEV